MMALDGLRDVFLLALAQSTCTPFEKDMLVAKWNEALKNLTDNYEIKGKTT